MPQCCRCNGNGRCKGCVCVRSGKHCTNCTQNQVGRCENRGGVASAEPDNQDQGRNCVNQDYALVNGQIENLGQPTEREGMELSDVEVFRESPLLDDRIEATLPHDNRTSIMESVKSYNYEDPWPLPSCSQPNFQWGSKDGKAFCDMIDEAYDDIVHWKRNIFLLPSGVAGKSFIQEITRLLLAFAEGSALECIALKASFVMQILLLQKPSRKSKSKDHVNHLKRRLELWKQGYSISYSRGEVYSTLSPQSPKTI